MSGDGVATSSVKPSTVSSGCNGSFRAEKNPLPPTKDPLGVCALPPMYLTLCDMDFNGSGTRGLLERSPIVAAGVDGNAYLPAAAVDAVADDDPAANLAISTD